MNEHTELLNTVNRRQLLKAGTCGLGSIALNSLMADKKFKAVKAKAKRVIYLFQAGGPSQLDMFDYKPKLNKLHGKHIFDYVKKQGRLTGFVNKHKINPIIGSKYKFKQYGNNGAWVSELLPHMSKVTDDVCWLKSVQTTPVNHDPAMTFMQTGHNLPGRPAMGSWLSYGLGSMNNNLPEFVVLLSFGDLGNMQPLNNRLWGNAFLPGKHQGVRFRSDSNVVSFLKDPSGKSLVEKKRMIDLLKKMNKLQFAETGNSEINTRISQYEMAFRMQTSVPDLADLSDEPASTFKLYGDDARKPGTYAFNCLMARRMAERDVRYIQLYHAGWDHHFNLPDHLPKRCKETDQGTAALIKDLKQRGLLDDTVVLWGGEFGRSPYSQNGKPKLKYGRDHHANCFTMIAAGGGFKNGVHGETDELGYAVADKPIHVHDLHATLLYQLGIDHTRLTFRSQGRDYRLTDVHGHIVKNILS